MYYISQDQALKSLGQNLRKKYGLPHEEALLFSEQQVGYFIKSEDMFYKRYGSVYKGEQIVPGGHSDFMHLKSPSFVGKTEEGKITAFYLDLKNFTKYCKFFPLNKVYQAKAITIEAVIDVCFTFGGHLHEIPGDGVLVFFGEKSIDDLISTTNAVLSACKSMLFLEETIIPEYNNENDYPDIYPKMGIDYGEALWGAYGASGCYEVKATSFYVDIASKMMNQCKSKQIAVGDNIKKFLQLEDKYLTTGEVYKRDNTVEGKKLSFSYNTWLFDWKQFIIDKTNTTEDLSKIGSIKEIIKPVSRTKLHDAPLA